MLPNIILAILALVTLGFIALVWVRQMLASTLRTVERQRSIMQTDLDRRRDMVPYLLEGFRLTEEPNEIWRELLNLRAEFHHATSMDKEWEFEIALIRFLNEHSKNNVSFLEAKKDIQDISDTIEKEKRTFQEAVNAYNAKRAQFPYSVAANIFGFKQI